MILGPVVQSVVSLIADPGVVSLISFISPIFIKNILSIHINWSVARCLINGVYL